MSGGAVRFIRHHAAEFGIDGQRLGISGSSAGGLLALVVAMQEQDGDPGRQSTYNVMMTVLMSAALGIDTIDLTYYTVADGDGQTTGL